MSGHFELVSRHFLPFGGQPLGALSLSIAPPHSPVEEKLSVWAPLFLHRKHSLVLGVAARSLCSYSGHTLVGMNLCIYNNPLW